IGVGISLKYHAVASLIGLSSGFSLPTLWQSFLSTFPLMFSTSIIMILVFRKILLNPFKIAIAMGIVFSFAVWLGGTLGISDFSFHDVNTNDISAGVFTRTLAFLIAFYMKYGAYKFFTSILTGVAIAWAVSIKLLPHLREITDEEDHHPKSGTS